MACAVAIVVLSLMLGAAVAGPEAAAVSVTSTPNSFGRRVALDGDTLVVTAPWAPSIPGTGSLNGRVYVFGAVPAGRPTDWQLLVDWSPGSAFSECGSALALDGDKMALGCAGRVLVFRRGATPDAAWQLERDVQTLDGTPGFGKGLVVLRGDVMVVANEEVTRSGQVGTAFVFECDRGGPANWGLAIELRPSDAGSTDAGYFGAGLAMTDGMIAVTSLPRFLNPLQGSGSLYTFEMVNNAWTETGRVAATVDLGLPRSDAFGRAVAVDTSATRLAVGAFTMSPNATREAGGVLMFSRGAPPAGWTLDSVLSSTEGQPDIMCGSSLGFSLDGSLLVVGCVGELLQFEELGGTWQHIDTFRRAANQTALSTESMAVRDYGLTVVGDTASRSALLFVTNTTRGGGGGGGGAASSGVIAAVVVGLAVVGAALALAAITLIVRRRRGDDKQGRSRANTLDITSSFLTNVQFLEPVGEGAFGQVFRGKWQGSDVALKALHVATTSAAGKAGGGGGGGGGGVGGGSGVDLNGAAAASKAMQAEMLMLVRLRHPNIINVFGMCHHNNTDFIVAEFMGDGSMLDLLRSAEGQRFSTLSMLTVSLHLANAMQHVQKHGIVHGDIAARNVLIERRNGQFVAKLGDFGMARIDGDRLADDERVPIRWLAPELVVDDMAQRRFTSASDVWAFGVTMWEVFSRGNRPFAELSNRQVLEQVCCESGRRLGRPAGCPDTVFTLMQQCWSFEPRKRPTFGKISTVLASSVSAANSGKKASGGGGGGSGSVSGTYRKAHFVLPQSTPSSPRGTGGSGSELYYQYSSPSGTGASRSELGLMQFPVSPR